MSSSLIVIYAARFRFQPGVRDRLQHHARATPQPAWVASLALRQPVIEGTCQREHVSSATQRMLDQLDSIPVFIRGRRWDILAWNRAARAFFFDFEKVPLDELPSTPISLRGVSRLPDREGITT
jgi:hypothetical protein